MGPVVTFSHSLASMHHPIVVSGVLFAVAIQTASAFGASWKTRIRSGGFRTTTTLCIHNEFLRDNHMKAWFEENPTLRAEMAASETRLDEEIAAAEARHVQELDRACALSSPRVAFEMRLDYLERNNLWSVRYGMIDNKRRFDTQFRNTDDFFVYGVGYGTWFFDLDDKAMAFLSKDHGNHVFCGRSGMIPGDSYQEVCLSVLRDPETMSDKKLKKVLRMRGMSTSGERTELVARLQKLKEQVEEGVKLPDFEL
jgi:hypothetical protein